MWGFLLDGTLMQWRWIKEGIAMLVGVLGTWPVIAGIGEEGEQWREEEWSMEEEELRIFRTIQTI